MYSSIVHHGKPQINTKIELELQFQSCYIKPHKKI